VDKENEITDFRQGISLIFRRCLLKNRPVRKFNDAFLIAFACRTKIYPNETKLFLFVLLILIRACTCE